MADLKTQLGDFVGPPTRTSSRRRRLRDRRPLAPVEPPAPEDGLARVGQCDEFECSVCGGETPHHCFKLSKGRGTSVRCLHIVLARDVHDDVLKAEWATSVDQVRYVAFWICTQPGHYAREGIAS